MSEPSVHVNSFTHPPLNPKVSPAKYTEIYSGSIMYSIPAA